jgi:hypothetical protein
MFKFEENKTKNKILISEENKIIKSEEDKIFKLKSKENVKIEENKEIMKNNLIENCYDGLSKLEYVNVKLIITEIASTNPEKILRRCISPILSKFHTQQNFGLFHT